VDLKIACLYPEIAFVFLYLKLRNSVRIARLKILTAKDNLCSALFFDNLLHGKKWQRFI
jgi:hypothetical protein